MNVERKVTEEATMLEQLGGVVMLLSKGKSEGKTDLGRKIKRSILQV